MEKITDMRAFLVDRAMKKERAAYFAMVSAMGRAQHAWDAAVASGEHVTEAEAREFAEAMSKCQQAISANDIDWGGQCS